MTTCCRCHRALTDPESKKRGLGPICASRRNAAVTEQESMLVVPPKSWPEFDYKVAIQKLAESKDEGEYVVYRLESGNGISAYFQAGDNPRIPLPHIVYHSPTGFEMGYGGSGPADLARSILAHAVGLPLADLLYQDFKFEFVACAKDKLVVSLSNIRQWVIKKMVEEGHANS